MRPFTKSLVQNRAIKRKAFYLDHLTLGCTGLVLPNMSRSPEDTFSSWAKVLAVVFAAFVVLNVVSYVWFPFLPWFEQRQAGENVIKQEIDADQAIDEYEWFRTQWNDIQAKRAHIEDNREALQRFYEIQGKDPDDWSRQAATRHNRIQQRITADKKTLENYVAEYNARSEMANREMFKCHLPYQVDKRFQISGPPGSGAPETPNDTYVEGASAEKTPPEPESCDGLPDQIQGGS